MSSSYFVLLLSSANGLSTPHSIIWIYCPMVLGFATFTSSFRFSDLYIFSFNRTYFGIIGFIHIFFSWRHRFPYFHNIDHTIHLPKGLLHFFCVIFGTIPLRLNEGPSFTTSMLHYPSIVISFKARRPY